MAVLKYRSSDGTIKTLGIKQTVGSSGVDSVNGKTGVVTGLYDAENPPPYPVTSVNGKEGAITGLYDAENPPPYPVTRVNGKTGDVTGLYDNNNPPPYPVTSVDGKTGDVESYSMLGDRKVFGKDGSLVFVEADGKIGGIASGVPHYCYSGLVPPPYPVTSVNGKTGDVTFTEIKVARVLTEPVEETEEGPMRHRFLKSSLPGINNNLYPNEAILSVVNASVVPMITCGFEYINEYVYVGLRLIDGGAVTNGQTLTILYR